MSETVASKIMDFEMPEFLAWVHCESQPEELEIIHSEVCQRLNLAPAPAARELVLNGKRVAGAYFTCLPGSLAILGSVRTLPQHEHLGIRLLLELSVELRAEYAISLIQAAVPEVDFAAQRMLEAAGFHYLATIDQMWLNTLHLTSTYGSSNSNSDSKFSELLQAKRIQQPENNAENFSQKKNFSVWQPQWTDTAEVSKASFLELLESTFQDSMDCPELNSLRSPEDVLDSFLMGRRITDITSWKVAWDGQQMIGCLILEDHENSVSEIVYMGLAPSARHRGLGQHLVGQAVERALKQGLSGVALAVDVRNVPAIKTYTRCSFRPLRRLKVYLISPGNRR